MGLLTWGGCANNPLLCLPRLCTIEAVALRPRLEPREPSGEALS